MFLDANVLFSAAYAPSSGLLALWEFPGVITSAQAAEEARRNLAQPAQLKRLEDLLKRMALESPAPAAGTRQRDAHGLPEKDRPILWAAIDLNATHLVTGDRTHFGRLFGETVEGVRVLTPRQFLDEQGAQRRI